MLVQANNKGIIKKKKFTSLQFNLLTPVNDIWCNGMVFDGTKPSPDPVLTYIQ